MDDSMQRQRSLLALILVLLIASLAIIISPFFPLELGLDLKGGSQLTIQVKTTPEIKEITEKELEAVQKVVEGRINASGVAEPLIQAVGSDQILVQLPGVDNPEEAERRLKGTAQLEFRQQKPDTEAQLFALRTLRGQLQTKQQELVTQKNEANPEEVDKNKADLEKNKQEIKELFASTEPPLSGKLLDDAYGEPTQGSNWNVAIRFKPQGGDLFAELTKQLAGTGRSIGIFLDDELISSPTVGPEFASAGITGGAAIITGTFTAQEAQDLGIQLKGGSLPVPVEVVEIRTVGATLGQDSIQRSIYAALGGLILVLIFMIVYYRLPGVIANVSLIIYSILTLACFMFLGVTLTLPGIAGFILSIGMAVDANVLIFERTREELRAGKSLYRSVESGFYRAFSSILDSNVTTLIACAALYFLGYGLVKGFAVTLAVGVVISMFTAITCSRTLMFLAISISSLRKSELFCPNLPTSKPAEVAK
ncbi:Protein-export membrane protein SecD (TC 3.A.5.1.1) [Richelia intracellularis]|nr:Protein-export membrane protein SecD (TC 3.A.5.1.1) [Richelia intracellularis]